MSADQMVADKSFVRLLDPGSPISILMNAPSWAEHDDALLLAPCFGRKAKDLLRCSSGQPIIQAVWIALRCSGADPSASRKLFRNAVHFRVARPQDDTSRGKRDRQSRCVCCMPQLRKSS